MQNTRMKFASLALLTAAVIHPFSIVLADDDEDGGGRDCRFAGTYGYSQEGTIYEGETVVDVAETGTLDVGDSGAIRGSARATFYFDSDSPLWLLLQNDFHGTYTLGDDCAGPASIFSTLVILESSPPILPPGHVLFEDAPRSIELTVTGTKGSTVEFISASAGSVTTGRATRSK